jgi:hypothetical protein
MKTNRTLPKFETACRIGGAALLLLAATASLAQEDRRDAAPGSATPERDRSGNEAGGGANGGGGGAAGPGGAMPLRTDGDRRDGGASGNFSDRNNAVGNDPAPPDNHGGPIKKGSEGIGSRAPVAAPSAPVVGAKGGAAGAKGGTADHGGIDLVRPDGGYGNNANLRRRAARRALATLEAKKPPSVPQLNVTIHTAPAYGTGTPQTRNALGIVAPVEDGRHVPGVALPHAPGSTAPVTTSPGVELHLVPPPRIEPHGIDGRTLTGINGTTMGHVAAGGGIGGPAKNRTGINGTSFRPK